MRRCFRSTDCTFRLGKRCRSLGQVRCKFQLGRRCMLLTRCFPSMGCEIQLGRRCRQLTSCFRPTDCIFRLGRRCRWLDQVLRCKFQLDTYNILIVCYLDCTFRLGR